jgi:hypothetical protein
MRGGNRLAILLPMAVLAGAKVSRRSKTPPRPTRRLVILATVSLSVISCDRVSITDSPEFAITSTASSPGFIFDNVTCENNEHETAIYDYAEDAVGFDTIEAAIYAFRVGADFSLREDWQGLTQGGTSISPAEFTDERGWVYLSVDVARWNDSWIVEGYHTCIPETS